MDDLAYKPVSHDHEAFLKKVRARKKLFPRHTMIWRRNISLSVRCYRRARNQALLKRLLRH